MARASIWRAKFDPAADFVVSRKLMINGKQLEVGGDFDKKSVTPRRLRQLCDQRRIEMKSKPATAAVVIKAKAVETKEVTETPLVETKEIVETPQPAPPKPKRNQNVGQRKSAAKKRANAR